MRQKAFLHKNFIEINATFAFRSVIISFSLPKRNRFQELRVHFFGGRVFWGFFSFPFRTSKEYILTVRGEKYCLENSDWFISPKTMTALRGQNNTLWGR